MKRDEIALVVTGPFLNGKFLGQVRRPDAPVQYAFSNPHARTREEAVAWVLETARKEFMDAGPEEAA